MDKTKADPSFADDTLLRNKLAELFAYLEQRGYTREQQVLLFQTAASDLLAR